MDKDFKLAIWSSPNIVYEINGIVWIGNFTFYKIILKVLEEELLYIIEAE